MKIIDGKKISERILTELKTEVSKIPFKPLFCDVLVGNDPVSLSYVKIKGRCAEKIGISFKLVRFPENIAEEELIGEIKNLNQMENICGLIVQLPLPADLDKRAILDAIDPVIDVDCMGTVNSQKFYAGDLRLPPPTAAAIMIILDSINADLTNKNILVIGQGKLVGKPVSFLLEKRGLKINVADKYTKDIPTLIGAADILITAAGKAGLIRGAMIKPGSIVIDAGTSESNGGIVGDVDFKSVSAKAAYVSPVPGGVGPVTVSMLLKNVLYSAKVKNRGALSF
jgi:methylenetetrahydrofolate dehydrogenase (NADP+)/methenyltetrahydrofolate cyclohydrolase